MKYRIVQNMGIWYLRCGNKNIQSFGRNKKLAEQILELWQDKYDIIYADPPWRYEHPISKSRAIESHYQTMKLEDICALPIPSKDDSVLFLWVTVPMSLKGHKVMKSWGFTYKTGLVWVKTKIGMGYYVRGRHELLFIGTKGKPKVPAIVDRRDSVINESCGKHSEKPKCVYDIIESGYPNCKYLELFARNKRNGWKSWGNEI